MAESEIRERARALFLDDDQLYGCAETMLLVLERRFRLHDRVSSSAVMALNGGVAYAGEICGVLSGGAVAAGLVAAQSEPDHVTAKRRARKATAQLITDFREEFGTVICRDLIGCDLSSDEQHDAFMDGGLWRTVCMRQIEFAATRLAALLEEPGSDEAAARSGGEA
jgi:C_GCAxxG_C_C family probable redox protein